MANYISNFVQVKEIRSLAHYQTFYKWLVEAQGATKGMMPFITSEEAEGGYEVKDSYMFDIYVNDGLNFSFESKWVCPLESLSKMCKKYHFSCVVETEEPSLEDGTTELVTYKITTDKEDNVTVTKIEKK